MLDVNQKLTVLSGGNVGIGTTAPTAKLKVDGGQIVAGQYTVASGSTVDCNNGNIQVLAIVGGSTIALNNMVDGAAYTLIVSDTISRTYAFPNCTNSHFVPANNATTSTKHTIYTILKVSIGGVVNCYISWLTGL